MLAGGLLGIVALAGCSSGSNAPQLGKAPLREVLAALTPDEKIKLVVGMGFSLPGLPPGVLPPSDPADLQTPERVPGAAGRTHAVARLGIPSLTLADGPAGVRIAPIRGTDSTKTYYATAFPVATLLASSWDTALVRRVGRAFGGEVRAYGIDVLLAPGLNIHRNPLGGRNFEYYSEDPLVAGSMAAALVQGVQANGVGTSLKHFAANNQEFNRMQLNSHIGERALREIYLRGFQIAVRRAQPWTVMSSYNKINGTYTSESPDLLTGILRQEGGFRGLVMSDWYGGRDAPAQLRAGNDLLMPGTIAQTDALRAALKSGALTAAQLDSNVVRVLRLVLRAPAMRGEKATDAPALKEDAAVARAAAAESLVLLRNENTVLPLATGVRVAAFGNTSYEPIAGGTGSGSVNHAYTVSVAQGLAAAGLPPSAPLAQAYAEYLRGEKARQPKPRSFLDRAVAIAEMPLPAALLRQQALAADVALVTLGRSAGESGDRQVAGDFTLTAAERALLRQVSTAFRAQKKRVVVVLNVGGVVEVASWRGLTDAILLAWQPGQEGGHAVADVLSGRVNPSGKLATTFPVKYTDLPYASDFPGRVLPGSTKPSNPLAGVPSENTYREGIYVGYRYFGTFGVRPAYEFGYGLSYTRFGYGPLALSAATFGGGPLTATLTITNAGQVPGREVVQLYLSAPTGRLPKPAAELKGFAKTRLLAPGQSQTLSFALAAAELASYDPAAEAWVAEAGTYTARAGASSLDIRQTAAFSLPKELTVEKSRRLLAPDQAIAELKAPAVPGKK